MRILVLTGKSSSLINLRGDFIKALVERSHDVFASSSDDEYSNEVALYGVTYYKNSCKRNGLNPFSDIKFCFQLMRLIKKERIEVVYSSTIKQVVYGSIAAYLCGVEKIYSLITGLGYVFVAKGKKNIFVNLISRKLYKFSLGKNNKVLFQNPDDRRYFVINKLVEADRTVVVDGSGVNLDRFKYSEITNRYKFLCIARLVKDKGLNEYLEAAKKVKTLYPHIEFHLVGGFDTNPNSITKEVLDNYIVNNYISYHGLQKDVRSYLSDCFVFVLPSYAEGTPRTVLEAMATGRAIITTDAPGCRETVIQGVNGFLVPVMDVDALVQRIIWMIDNSDHAVEMGIASRKYVEQRYDVHKVNQKIIYEMEL